MVSSDMMRAKQTAQLAHEELRTGPGEKVQGAWFNGCGEPQKIKAYMGLAETVPYFTLPMLETVCWFWCLSFNFIIYNFSLLTVITVIFS